jgi:hypothetical protein
MAEEKKDKKEGKGKGQDRRRFLKNLGGTSLALMSFSLIRNIETAEGQTRQLCDPGSDAGWTMQSHITGGGFYKVECCESPFGSAQAVVHVYKHDSQDNKYACLYEVLDGSNASAFGTVMQINDWETLDGSVDFLRFSGGEIVETATTTTDVISVVSYPDPFNPVAASVECLACVHCMECGACLFDSIVPDLEGFALAALAAIIGLGD